MAITDHMSRAELMQVQSAARMFQERYDSALGPWDRRAPSPTLGQTVEDYRKETLVKMKKLLPDNHKLRISIRRLDADTLNILDPQICRAVRDEAYNPNTVPPGELRRVVETDGNGAKMVRWIGTECFTRQMGREGRRVVSFMHRYDSTGRAFH